MMWWVDETLPAQDPTPYVVKVIVTPDTYMALLPSVTYSGGFIVDRGRDTSLDGKTATYWILVEAEE